MEETNVLKQRKGERNRALKSQLYEESKNIWTTYTSDELSPITSIFSFLIKRTSTCCNCNNRVSSHQSHTSLSLPLPLHNVMIITVIVYSPFFVNQSTLINPPPRQLTLQVSKEISIHTLQILLSHSDPLHFPPSYYSIQTSQKQYCIEISFEV